MPKWIHEIYLSSFNQANHHKMRKCLKSLLQKMWSEDITTTNTTSNSQKSFYKLVDQIENFT